MWLQKLTTRGSFMKKLLRYLLSTGAILFCLVIAAIFLTSSLAPDFIATGLSKNLKVPVSIESMSFSFDSITVKKLDVANLPNSRLQTALSVNKICSKANLLNYLDNTIRIEQITLDDIYLGLEFDSAKGTQGNWTVLMGNLEATTASAPKENTKSVIIKELVLTNIQVDVFYRASGGDVKRLKPIPRIVLYNINSSQGFPTDQIMQSVLGQMLKSVFVDENLKNMFEGLFLDQPKNAIDSVLQPLKGFWGR